MLTAIHTIGRGIHKVLCHLAQNGSYHYLGYQCPMPMTAIMKINDTNMDLTEYRRTYQENPSDEQLIEFLKATDARIRKGTPREYFRLMDVDDEDIDKIEQAVPPKTQRYKLAGNSIVVACMYYIFESLFYGTGNAEPQQLTLKF